jgi:hypothetical protein
MKDNDVLQMEFNYAKDTSLQSQLARFRMMLSEGQEI